MQIFVKGELFQKKTQLEKKFKINYLTWHSLTMQYINFNKELMYLR